MIDLTMPSVARLDLRRRLGRWPAPGWTHVAPLAGATIISAAIVLPAPWPNQALTSGGIALMAAATIGTWLARTTDAGRSRNLLPAGAFFAAIALIRVGTGGPEAGLTPLLLVPLLWLAFLGTPRQLQAGYALFVAALILPITFGAVSSGGLDIPHSELRRGAVLVVVAGFTAAMVQKLAGQLRAATERAEAQAVSLAEQSAVTGAILATADDMILTFGADGQILEANASVVHDLGWNLAELLGADVGDTLVAPDERARFDDTIRSLQAADSATARDARIDTLFRTADGAVVDVDVSIVITGERDRRLFHAFARDISARRRAERAARDHLDDLARLLAVARDLGRPAGTGAGAGDGRDAVCEAARDLTSADLALFFEARPDRGLLVSTGASGDSARNHRVTLDSRASMTAHVFASGEPAFIGDLELDDRVDHATARRMGVRAAYWQPVVRDGRPIGVLIVYWRGTQPEISERIRSLLELFATQAAGVVERADLMDRLEILARTDALTGLANRRGLEETLVAALAGSERTGEPLSVAMFDLDHFKRYNDERGHQAGDWLLRETAERWVAELRPADTLARYGGEEFIAILPACDAATAVAVADRLRALVPGGETTSAGVATWLPTETMSDLIARVDGALYRAKRRGRNRTETATGQRRRTA
ncbi:MAG TPA: diguanylate cyclase [Candidatus Limnocylindrales bacterium]|nr:diguanylate cyclase [Candidatus Limnocylindrales bacterium]